MCDDVDTLAAGHAEPRLKEDHAFHIKFWATS